MELKKIKIRKHLFAILTILLVLSCDNDEINRTDEDERILKLAYSKDYFYPTGFYHEIIDSGSIYYENTVSIKTITERDHIWIELHTNNKNEARVWSDKSNEYSSVNREIVSERETDKYFEFRRKNIEHEQDILLSRVHKTDYFMPSLDKFKEPDTIGVYNGILATDNVKELVEYLWSCGSIGYINKVIESRITDNNSGFEYYIQSIKIAYGDFNIYDYISVYDNYFRINKIDRTLVVEINEVKTIQGKYN